MTSFWHPMDSVHVYRAWQAPFAERKLRPVLDALKDRPVARVLDVGCGPGTNAAHFLNVDYLGVDINPRYIEHATRRYGSRFRVEDVTQMKLETDGGFDCILVNSLLHHLSDHDVHTLLARLHGLLTPDGAIHILDLVMPLELSVARLLAEADRGRNARSLCVWRAMFAQSFVTRRFEPYALRMGRLTLWRMVYFEGGRRDLVR